MDGIDISDPKSLAFHRFAPIIDSLNRLQFALVGPRRVDMEVNDARDVPGVVYKIKRMNTSINEDMLMRSAKGAYKCSANRYHHPALI